MFRIFKLPKYNRFNYEPRYFDPEKEERENRVKELVRKYNPSEPAEKISATNAEKVYTPMIKGQMKHYMTRKKAGSNRASNIRLAAILSLLFLISYLIFYV